MVTLTHVKTARTLTVRLDGSTEATLIGPRGGQIQVGMVRVATGELPRAAQSDPPLSQAARRPRFHG